jgi:hypothetical protein
MGFKSKAKRAEAKCREVPTTSKVYYVIYMNEYYYAVLIDTLCFYPIISFISCQCMNFILIFYKKNSFLLFLLCFSFMLNTFDYKQPIH